MEKEGRVRQQHEQWHLAAMVISYLVGMLQQKMEVSVEGGRQQQTQLGGHTLPVYKEDMHTDSFMIIMVLYLVGL
jgi:hypothetical protein